MEPNIPAVKSVKSVNLLKLPHSNDDCATRTCPSTRKIKKEKIRVAGVFPEGNELLVVGGTTKTPFVYTIKPLQVTPSNQRRHSYGAFWS